MLNSSMEGNLNTLLHFESRPNLRWGKICQKFLPYVEENSIWRYNRQSRREEPLQGWKIHVSATVLTACDVFETIVDFLTSQDVQFKAPGSLSELSKLNSGLFYGYSQVGKFITIYPQTDQQSVFLAEKIHQLTVQFSSPAVPYDKPFAHTGCVFYRYGIFRKTEFNALGNTGVSGIKNPQGNLVNDNRLQPVPDWLTDPFEKKIFYRESQKKLKSAC